MTPRQGFNELQKRNFKSALKLRHVCYTQLKTEHYLLLNFAIKILLRTSSVNLKVDNMCDTFIFMC